MNKEKIIVILGKLTLALIIVALVFVSGCVQTGFEPCAQFHPNSQDKDNCLADYAEQHKDPEICELIYVETEEEACYHSVAMLTNNVELCTKRAELRSTFYSEEERQRRLGHIANYMEGSRTVCIKTIATNLTDETICGYIDDRQAKEGCYLDIAEITKNETLCNKSTSETLRKECIKGIRFPECEGKDHCLRDYAKQYEDAEICELIKSEFSREMCKNDVAVLTSDTELCKVIGMSPIKDDCFKTIAINLTDEIICKQISDTGKPLPQSQYTYKDECYNEIAGLTGNKTICDKIKNEELREDCIKHVGA